MPKRTTRTIPRLRSTILRVTELERRDTPAWWAIAAPTIAGGTPGSTVATITGELTLNPDYEATNGVVTVWADTPVHAATLALAGTMNAKFADHDRAHAFLQENVSDQASDHKSFLVVPNGTGGVDVLLEDMAGDPDADYDYNDQTWDDLPTPNASNPIIFEGDFHWTGSGGDVTIHEKVEAVSDTVYKWNYHLRNDSFVFSQNNGYGGSTKAGIGAFVVPLDWPVVHNPGGSNTVFNAMNGALGGGVPNWWWVTRSQIMPGAEADFWFNTDPLPLIEVTGSAWELQGRASAVGAIKAPGRNDVRIEITDKTGTPIGADGLKVAKWENAFNVAGGTASVKPVDAVSGLDIIDGDDDRFNVWVYDKAKWDAKTPHIKAKISTDNVVGFTQYNDPASEIDLVRRTDGARPPGWFWSDSQMLVSNAMDDTAAIPGVGGDENPLWGLGAPKNGYTWHKSDRTHRVALRGTVKAEYTPNVGPAASDTKAVPMRHYVNADVRIMRAPGAAVGVISVDKANEDFVRANEMFAQVGILVVPKYNVNNISIASPIGVLLGNGLDEFKGLDSSRKIIMTREEELLLDATVGAAKGAKTDEVKVYYVNFLTSNGSSPGSIGEAFPSLSSPSIEYEDSVILSADLRTRSFRLMAHELGHILTNQEHYSGSGVSTNLMKVGPPAAADSLVAERRLNTAQDALMHSARANAGIVK